MVQPSRENDSLAGPELERYQHLTPELRAWTVNLIATELFRGKRARKERENGTPTGTVRGRRVTEKLEGANMLIPVGITLACQPKLSTLARRRGFAAMAGNLRVS